MTIVAGQLSLLDLIEPAREVKLPFTVSTGPGKYEHDFCAYCGTNKRLNEGGAGPAGNSRRSYYYQICDPCSEAYRGMRPPSDQWTFKEVLP